jgi:membrane-associated PAP2 superfamily phosphatase
MFASLLSPVRDWRITPNHFTSLERCYLIGLCVILVIYCLASVTTNIDLAFQGLFYNSTTSEWFIDRYNAYLRGVFYTGIKIAIAAFGIYVLLMVILLSLSKRHEISIRALLFVLVCLIVVPSSISYLKYLSGIACPYQISSFGGMLQHINPFDMSLWSHMPDRPRCFPAGHPSGGFALYALMFVSPYKKTMFFLALCAGGAMSAYQIMRGAHFLSHCLITLLLSLLITYAIYAMFLLTPIRVPLK